MRRLEHILYVEDEPDIRELTVMTLTLLGGYRVTAAGSGAQALRLADQGPFDLMLLDRMLPDMDGLQLAATLRARPGTADLPAILMTAHAADDQPLPQKDGWLGRIGKPFDPESLPAELARLWQNTVT